jgi:hypothetical protein
MADRALFTLRYEKLVPHPGQIDKSALGIGGSQILGNYGRTNLSCIYSPPTPKPYKFAGIRGFGDKIK